VSENLVQGFYLQLSESPELSDPKTAKLLLHVAKSWRTNTHFSHTSGTETPLLLFERKYNLASVNFDFFTTITII
jgi:hypothetical protein